MRARQDAHRSTIVMTRDGTKWLSNIPEPPASSQMVATGGKAILTGIRADDNNPQKNLGAWSRISYDLRTFTPRAPLFGVTEQVIGAPSAAVLVPSDA